MYVVKKVFYSYGHILKGFSPAVKIFQDIKSTQSKGYGIGHKKKLQQIIEKVW